MGMVRKMISGARAGKSKKSFFGRLIDRAREEGDRRQPQQAEEEQAPRGRTRRPVDEPLMMGGSRNRSLMKQRLGS